MIFCNAIIIIDAVVDVPLGTMVYDVNGHVVKDMSYAKELFLLAR